MSRQRKRGANIWLVNHDDVKVTKGQGVTQPGAENKEAVRREERKLRGNWTDQI